jgi:hypothetical protein
MQCLAEWTPRQLQSHKYKSRPQSWLLDTTQAPAGLIRTLSIICFGPSYIHDLSTSLCSADKYIWFFWFAPSNAMAYNNRDSWRNKPADVPRTLSPNDNPQLSTVDETWGLLFDGNSPTDRFGQLTRGIANHIVSQLIYQVRSHRRSVMLYS